MNFDVQKIRSDFPALKNGHIFFDGPGGTQVPRQTMDAMVDYLTTSNANTHGPFLTSRRSDQTTANARECMADFLNADSSREIVFGPNMTTLTFSLSRAIGRTLQPGDEIIVTRLDHDANISPWTALEERGAVIQWVDIHPEDCTLNMESLAAALSTKTRIVAVGYASNLMGTLTDVKAMTTMAHDVGALVFVDAVAAAPHIPIDVKMLDCDFLACSSYKLYGPHLGILYGKYTLLDRLSAYKVRPADDLPPDKWETGTQNFEGQAGLLATINYLATLGQTCGHPFADMFSGYKGRRHDLKTAMMVVYTHEHELFKRLLEGVGDIAGLEIFGIKETGRIDQRAPILAFRLEGFSPRQISEKLAAESINAWDGDCYALEPVKRLGLSETGGVVRVGLSMYSTAAEVDRLIDILRGLRAK